MVTVMRQKSFHKPNGSACDRKRMGGRGGKVKRDIIIAPYKKGKTKSMKKIYAELRRNVPPVSREVSNTKRNLRRKLAKAKMPMPVSSKDNPKKNRYVRRKRCVVWPSEKNPLPRYRYDGTVK